MINNLIKEWKESGRLDTISVVVISGVLTLGAILVIRSF